VVPRIHGSPVVPDAVVDPPLLAPLSSPPQAASDAANIPALTTASTLLLRTTFPPH